MKYVKLTVGDAQKLMDYLVRRPWAEVNQLIGTIQRSVNEEKEEPDGDRRLNDKAGSSKSSPASS